MPRVASPLSSKRPSVFYLELYFYSSHIMSFAWSVLYYMSICFFFLFSLSQVSFLDTLREPKLCYDLLELLYVLHLNFLSYGIALVLHLYLLSTVCLIF